VVSSRKDVGREKERVVDDKALLLVRSKDRVSAGTQPDHQQEVGAYEEINQEMKDNNELQCSTTTGRLLVDHAQNNRDKLDEESLWMLELLNEWFT
jgi:hypothetical protein